MVTLPFFDKSVTLATKHKVVDSLESTKKVPLKYTKIDFTVYEQKELDDFVLKNTLQFFKKT